MSIGTAVVVGRFQTPYLHEGHKSLLNYADFYDKLIIFVGCHPVPNTKENPLDFATRKLMLSEYVRDDAIIMPLMDHPLDEVWSNNLDNMISTLCPFDKITLVCGRDGFKDHYHGKFTVEEVDFGVSKVCATDLRKEVANRSGRGYDFRKGVIYAAYNNYPRVNPTVDVAVYKYGKDVFADTEVLLARKPGRNKWCFIGGFIDGKDPSAEAAAVRELSEETDLCVDQSELMYVSSRAINDWRNSSSNSIITTFFAAEYVFGHPVAKDDIEEVKWFNIYTGEYHIAEHHAGLYEDLLSKLHKNHPEWKSRMLLKLNKTKS